MINQALLSQNRQGKWKWEESRSPSINDNLCCYLYDPIDCVPCYLYDPIDCVRHTAATEWGKYTEKTVIFCQLIAEFNTMQERKQNILTSVLPFGSETAGSNNQ